MGVDDAASARPRLRRRDASAYLREMHGLDVAPNTLASYATKGGGPLYNKAGRIPLYPVAELDAWAHARLGSLMAHSGKAAA